MCFQTIPVVSQPRSTITHRWQCNLANLRPISTSSTAPLSFYVGLWNCQSAVNKADFISAFSLQSTLSIFGLTETWIRPEDSATPAALSNNFSFSHTPCQVGRGGGTGLLISNNWKSSTHSPLCNYNSIEYHVITVTAPIKLLIVIISLLVILCIIVYVTNKNKSSSSNTDLHDGVIFLTNKINQHLILCNSE